MRVENIKQCANCGTIRYPIKARGYCKRCYSLILRREKTEKWDYREYLENKNLEHFPRFGHKIRLVDFETLKKGTIEEISNRLERHAFKEGKLYSGVTSHDLEVQLREIAKLARVQNKNLFHGYEGVFRTKFSAEQRKFIYILLLQIEENVRQKEIIGI